MHPRTLARGTCSGGSCPAVYDSDPDLAPDQLAIVGKHPHRGLASRIADRVAADEAAVVIPRHLVEQALRPADEPIGPDELMAALASPLYSAWRIETSQHYIGLGRDDEWVALLEASRRFTPRRTYTRAHVVTWPLTPSMRTELTDGYGPNADAGENIFIIEVAAGEWPEDVPHEDSWLLDSSRLLVMHYAPDMTFQGAARVTDPQRIAAACRARDAALSRAVPWRTYVASRPELQRRMAQ